MKQPVIKESATAPAARPFRVTMMYHPRHHVPDLAGACRELRRHGFTPVRQRDEVATKDEPPTAAGSPMPRARRPPPDKQRGAVSRHDCDRPGYHPRHLVGFTTRLMPGDPRATRAAKP